MGGSHIEVNDNVKSRFCGTFAGTGALLSLLLLVACHKDSNSGAVNADAYGPNPFPSGVPGVTLTFVRHQLTGLSGSPVVAFETPPYVIGTANNGSGELTVLDAAYIGL